MPDTAPARPQTEAIHPQAQGLDTLAPARILSILLDGQIAAAEAVRSALPALGQGAEAMRAALLRGGNIVYAAAGSSALQALADGLEIPPTFGIPAERIHILRAGGYENMTRPREGAEDDATEAAAHAAVIGERDCVLCLAASGNTIYPNVVLDTARARGAFTIGMANNPGSRLLAEADLAILLPTPPEVIAGSTRLGAGTAQKIALNLMSTLLGIRMGHVMDGLMVNVATSNRKLRGRAAEIVQMLSGCDAAAARRSLEASGWKVKEAVLIARGAGDAGAARGFLEQGEESLRAALALLDQALREQRR